jgi:hypothetical protein
MTCIFEQYQSFYFNPDKEYYLVKINLEKYKRGQSNLRLNALMRDEKCSCKSCNPYTGSHVMSNNLSNIT